MAAPAFVVGSDQSFGRFPVAMDRYVYHPQGYVFASALRTRRSSGWR